MAVLAVGSASATDRIVDGTGPDNPNCTVATPCATLGAALLAAQQGDTIIINAGVALTEGELVIDKNFITIRSSWGADAPVNDGVNRTLDPVATPSTTTCDANEACIDIAGFDYALEIQANNVTIDGLQILGDADGANVAYAGIVILGGYDRWTIKNVLVHNIANKRSGSSFNLSFGVFGNANITSGSATMTGNEIKESYFYNLGGENVGGVNVTAGVGIYLEGLEGDVAECNAIDKFLCGAWVHDNTLFELARGININNFTEFVDGREPSVGVVVPQDEENALPNNGARINANTYDDHSSGTELDTGVAIGIGGSLVEEANANFTNTLAYVANAGRRAVVDELLLAPFWKSSNPNPQSVLGPDSDAYFASQTLAEDNSADDATIVHLTAGPAHSLTVYPGGETTSVKVSIDNDGDLNVREGARLLYDDAFHNSVGPVAGVAEVLFNGTDGDDLLTVDFVNGNPVPRGIAGGGSCELLEHASSDDCGIQFDGADGFDKVIIRGQAQSVDEAIYMGNGGNGNASDEGSGTIVFEPLNIAAGTITPGTSRLINFMNIEPIDDVVIVNGTYAIVLQDDVNHEVNFVDGPTVFGSNTFQINSGAVPTFEKVNFRNKKDVVVYGGDDTTGGTNSADDIFTLFTPDGDAPALLQSVALYGGDGSGVDTGDDYFVVRPSADFPIAVYGDDDVTADWFFLDCADVTGCDPSVVNAVVPVVGASTLPSIAGFEDVTINDIEETADDLGADDVEIAKTVNTFGDAHPGDAIEFTVTVTKISAGSFDLSATPVWVTDVIDHRFSVDEQSIVVDEGTVDITDNRALLWRLDDDAAFTQNEVKTMTYSVIVNTLLTTDDIDNWSSVLNPDNDLTNNHDSTSVDVTEVFGFPAKAAIQASVFAPTQAGPRYIVGLYGGALDPATLNIGPVMCRVPDQNKAAGWDGGLGNLWYSCGEGLPAKDGLFSPLVVTDLFRDQSGRIWLTSWGFGGLYYSDDDGKTWTDPFLDLTGGPGGAPDGIDDPVAQIYAITEDIIGTLYISANNGDMYRSFDGGGTWQKAKQLPLGSADTPWSLEADPTAPGKLYAGTFGDSLYVTTNFGETWQKPEGNGLGNGHIFDIEFDPISGNIFVGTALGVYYTADEGDNWNGLNTAFPEPTVPPEVRHVAFDENGVLYIGTWGQGVWVSSNWQATALDEFALQVGQVQDLAVMDGGVFVLSAGAEMMRFDGVAYSSSVDTEDEGPAQVPTTYALEQNYPNPFNPTTTIEFALPATSEVSLAVYDMLGRRVALLVNGQLTTGQHRIQFNASSLPSGMYLYRLTTPTGAVTKKMMLIK
jgi:photosystem II stability/assembly factor-like uncharacterized protein